jgi:hypothetical protein
VGLTECKRPNPLNSVLTAILFEVVSPLEHDGFTRPESSVATLADDLRSVGESDADASRSPYSSPAVLVAPEGHDASLLGRDGKLACQPSISGMPKWNAATAVSLRPSRACEAADSNAWLSNMQSGQIAPVPFAWTSPQDKQ